MPSFLWTMLDDKSRNFCNKGMLHGNRKNRRECALRAHATHYLITIQHFNHKTKYSGADILCFLRRAHLYFTFSMHPAPILLMQCCFQSGRGGLKETESLFSTPRGKVTITWNMASFSIKVYLSPEDWDIFNNNRINHVLFSPSNRPCLQDIRRQASWLEPYPQCSRYELPLRRAWYPTLPPERPLSGYME